MKKSNPSTNEGLTLVEVLLATSIILVFLLALVAVNNTYLRSAFSNTNSIKATFLAEEMLEAIRFLRNSSWDSEVAPLSYDVGYSMILESGSWQATTTITLIDNIFEPVIMLSEVYRDPSGIIVSSGGTLDQDTRFVTATVSWKVGSATTTKTVATYISNILE